MVLIRMKMERSIFFQLSLISSSHSKEVQRRGKLAFKYNNLTIKYQDDYIALTRVKINQKTINRH